MTKSLSSAFLVNLIFTSLLSAASTDVPVDISMPDSFQFETVRVDVPVANDSSTTLNVSVSQGSSDRLSVAGPLLIPPHSTGQLPLSVKVMNDIGAVAYSAKLTKTGSQDVVQNVFLHGFVQSAFDDEKPSIDFGIVSRAQTPHKSLQLSTHEVGSFRLTDVASAPEWLAVSIDENAHAVVASVNSNRPLGLVEDYVKLRTDNSKFSEVWVLVKMDSRGAVVPSQNPVNFAVLREGAGGEQQVRLEEVQHKALKIESIRIDGAEIAHSLEDCTEAADWCKTLRLRVPKNQPKGQIWATAFVRVSNQPQEIPIAVRGFIIPENLKVIDLNDTKYQQQNDSKSASNSDLASDIKRATSSVAAATPPSQAKSGGSGSTLHWATKRDQGIYGYIVYRSDDEKGPFVRINKDIVKASGNGQDGGAYEWHDDSGVKGHTYWYYIGLVRTNGTKQQLSGPQKAVAK